MMEGSVEDRLDGAIERQGKQMRVLYFPALVMSIVLLIWRCGCNEAVGRAQRASIAWQ